jgi:hypothetical protein
VIKLIAGIFVSQSETNKKGSRCTSKRKLGFEVLEGRELLSANWTGNNFDEFDDYLQDNFGSDSYYESSYSSDSGLFDMSLQSSSTTSSSTVTIPDPVYTLSQETTFDGSTFYTIGSNSGDIGNITG